MSAKTTKPELESTVWILAGLTGSAVGILSLEDGRLAYTAYGQGALSGRHCRKLARLSGQADLAGRLKDEEGVRILDEPLDALRFSFPWYTFGGGMTISTTTASFRFSFLRPANTMAGAEAAVTAGKNIVEGREAGRRWRQRLTSSHPSS